MPKTEKGAKPGKGAASPDELTKKGAKGSIELSEEELKRVSGGAAIKINELKWV